MAFAELNYRLAKSLRQNSQFIITELNLPFLTQKNLALNSKIKVGTNLANEPALLQELVAGLIDRGDLFVARVRLHTPANGALAEQFSRENGYAKSARDLTWSYASFLTAIHFRNHVLKGVP